MKIKLREFYEGAIKKQCLCSLENGKGFTNVTYLFEPDTEYEITDPVAIQFFTGALGDVNEHLLQTPELLEQLKQYDVPYEVKKCSTCPTAKPHVYFNPFEIVEE